jgi:threonine dehydrogenase-like Zn-dependent dehydrogenase
MRGGVEMSPSARALQDRLAGTPTVALLGLGYVGLPLAVAFAESGAAVRGVDPDPHRMTAIRSGVSFIEDLHRKGAAVAYHDCPRWKRLETHRARGEPRH